MDIYKQKQHERRYDSWTQLKTGGRLYRKEVAAKNGSGWKAIYLQEVDEKENIVKFWQEIYDEKNILIEIHEKYPENKGHKPFKMES